MTYGLSKETLSRTIATVAAYPGWTRTERMTDVPASKLKQLQSPEYVGRAVVYLATDSAEEDGACL